MSYKILGTEHGVYVVGSIPIDDFMRLGKALQKGGLTLCDGLLATHLCASCVFTSEDGSRAWRQSLGLLVEATASDQVALDRDPTRARAVSGRARSPRPTGEASPRPTGEASS